MSKSTEDYADDGFTILAVTALFVGTLWAIRLAYRKEPELVTFIALGIVGLIVAIIGGYWLCVGIGMAAERIREHGKEIIKKYKLERYR